MTLSLSLFPIAPTLEHRTSVKRFVSLQFLNPRAIGRVPRTGAGRGDQPVARPLPTQTQYTQIRTHDPSGGGAKTVTNEFE
jgi:hypothetical protein